MIRNEKRVLPTRRMGVIAVREMARHRYRQSQFAGLTRLQLDEVGRERQVQRQGRQRAEALAEGSVELAQAMVPLASALARGGGCRVSVLVSVCSAVTAGRCARLLILGIVLRSGGVCVRVNLRFFWGAFVSCCFACGCVLELVVCRVRFARVCLAPVRALRFETRS